MSTKLIDISYWQGNLDFKKLKSAGINYIILRAGYRTTKDQRFDQYAKACQSAGIKIIGAYWFSYALNTTQAKNEANLCINACKPYNIPTIFYDFEYDTVNKAKAQGVALGSKECNDFTIAFCDSVKAAGIAPGYYCNDDYYKTMYSDRVKNKGYYLWYAHYKSDYSYHESPISCDIFQYSSRVKLTGFNQNFDGDICYNSKLLGNSTNSSTNNSSNTNKGSDTVAKITKEQAINAVIKMAQNEIGYLEKKSNSQLDSKTANAGYANITKYWRDVYPAYQGQAWCACFISWIFMKTFGLTMAKKLLKHWPYVYCPTLGTLFTKNANPKVGDIVIFYRSGEFKHTGLVTKVQGDRFWTIEGNTSGASGIVANGGGVCAKSYYNSQLPGTKFCTPNYSLVTSIASGNSSTSTSATTTTNTKNYLTVGDKGADVKTLQTKLNKVGYKLTVDGEYGSATKAAVTSFQKKYNLEVDGIAGKNTIAKLDSVIAAQSKNNTSTVSKAPSKVRKFVGRIKDNASPVRKNPGQKYDQLTSYPILNKGDLVDVCDTVKSTSGNDWYYICIASKYYGYIYSGHVERV